MTGTEVERVGTVGAPAGREFRGRPRRSSVEQHPDADRLSVCTVDTGDGERTIVCGAPNVAAGQTVAVALPGAVLPDGNELKKAKLRGVESDGMILSEPSSEIGEDSDGSWCSRGRERSAPGTPLAEVLPIAEPVLELEVTPNRPDCLGVYGVAREVHAITEAAARARARGRRTPRPSGEGDVSRLRLGHGRGPRALPALHRARLHRRRRSARRRLAEGAADAPPASGRSTTSSTSPTT